MQCRPRRLEAEAGAKVHCDPSCRMVSDAHCAGSVVLEGGKQLEWLSRNNIIQL